jgi:hypothetical protein
LGVGASGCQIARDQQVIGQVVVRQRLPLCSGFIFDFVSDAQCLAIPRKGGGQVTLLGGDAAEFKADGGELRRVFGPVGEEFGALEVFHSLGEVATFDREGRAPLEFGEKFIFRETIFEHFLGQGYDFREPTLEEEGTPQRDAGAISAGTVGTEAVFAGEFEGGSVRLDGLCRLAAQLMRFAEGHVKRVGLGLGGASEGEFVKADGFAPRGGGADDAGLRPPRARRLPSSEGGQFHMGVFQMS